MRPGSARSALKNTQCLPAVVLGQLRFVTPGYTRALGLSLIAGRHMSERDLNRPVVLISRSLAEQLPADAHIVGSHFNFFDPHGGPNKPLQVVGIVEDVRATADKPAPPTIYVPDWEWPPWGSALVVRTNGNPGAVAEALRATIRRADPRLALSEVRTIRSVFNGATASRRYVSELAMGFALSATLLAVLGVYGLASLAAAQRTVRSAFAWRWEQDRRTFHHASRPINRVDTVGSCRGHAACACIRSSAGASSLRHADESDRLCLCRLLDGCGLHACRQPASATCITRGPCERAQV